MLRWSLGSAVAQELALAHPGRIGALVLYATWGGSDGYMRAMFAALRTPWENGDAETGLTALRLNFSRAAEQPRFRVAGGQAPFAAPTDRDADPHDGGAVRGGSRPRYARPAS